jgi:ABC-2 type transport system permease protein
MRRFLRAVLGIAAMQPKMFLAYRIWVWMQFAVQILSMTVLVYFWRAVYASSASDPGGMTLQQTINYILLAQILLPLVTSRLIFEFGFIIRDGRVGIELLRPLDFQGRYYVEGFVSMWISLALALPLLAFAWLVFGLDLPNDLATWAAFLVALVLGHAVIFCFDWLFASLAFYTTETWGLSVVREAVAVFFSGALVPLAMMPAWLQSIAAALPFAQALAVPVSLLSGVLPASEAPRLWLVQLLWLGVLALASRLFFGLAVRKVTVQGG